MEQVPVVILCGGMGTRLREQTEYIPKALVPIGNMPVLLHVMKIYAHYGHVNFILCLGYKGEMVKQYFMNYDLISSDFRLRLGPKMDIDRPISELNDWEIMFADTGLETSTGGRIKKIEKYINTENFLATYCDGLADIDLKRLLEHHLSLNRIGTVTGVHPMSPFGIIEEKDGIAISFKEKPVLPGLVNGGFFAFNKRFFDYLDDDSVLEEEPLRRLASERQLAVYRHEGFWACMDTFKDFERLNRLWETGYLPHVGVHLTKPPWKIWK